MSTNVEYKQVEMKLTLKQISRIKHKISLGDKSTIVRINVSEDKTMSLEESSYNIYRINENNEIIWQIREDTMRTYDDMFVYLGMNEKGEIIADRWSGFKYIINPETGKAECTGFHK